MLLDAAEGMGKKAATRAASRLASAARSAAPLELSPPAGQQWPYSGLACRNLISRQRLYLWPVVQHLQQPKVAVYYYAWHWIFDCCFRRVVPTVAPALWRPQLAWRCLDLSFTKRNSLPSLSLLSESGD